MPVRHLSLNGFRSYEQLELDLGRGPHVVVGPNAAGKTNLVEALVVLSQGRSHRGSADPELVRWGGDFARAAAVVEQRRPTRRASRSSIHAAGTAPGSRKRVRVNGVNRRPSALSAVLRSVLFAPEDMLLVVGSPSLRRGFLDDLVSQREPHGAPRCSRPTPGRSRSATPCCGGSARRWPIELSWPTGTTVLCRARRPHPRLARARPSRTWLGPLAAAHAEIAPDEAALELRYASNVEPRPGETPQRGAATTARRRRPRRSSGTAPRWWAHTATTSSSWPAAAT